MVIEAVPPVCLANHLVRLSNPEGWISHPRPPEHSALNGARACSELRGSHLQTFLEQARAAEYRADSPRDSRDGALYPSIRLCSVSRLVQCSPVPPRAHLPSILHDRRRRGTDPRTRTNEPTDTHPSGTESGLRPG